MTFSKRHIRRVRQMLKRFGVLRPNDPPVSHQCAVHACWMGQWPGWVHVVVDEAAEAFGGTQPSDEELVTFWMSVNGTSKALRFVGKPVLQPHGRCDDTPRAQRPDVDVVHSPARSFDSLLHSHAGPRIVSAIHDTPSRRHGVLPRCCHTGGARLLGNFSIRSGEEVLHALP